jgi:uncharacterized protein (DUF697 family)
MLAMRKIRFIASDVSIKYKWTMKNDAHDTDQIVIDKIRKYSNGAMGTMVAIPLPGADMAATYVLWGKMIHDLAHVYGEVISPKDARVLAGELFKGVILTTIAWFASAKAATTVLKFIPGAGTAVAYLVDAVIAGYGARKITTALGFAAAAYYKSGKTMKAKDMRQEVAAILKDPKVIATLLGAISPIFRKAKSGKIV